MKTIETIRKQTESLIESINSLQKEIGVNLTNDINNIVMSSINIHMNYADYIAIKFDAINKPA